MAIQNTENWLKFIHQYKNLRELWDINSEKNKNKNLRTKAYQKLLEEYKNIDKSATIDMVKKKIKNMRTAYNRQLKKKQTSKKSNPYEPTLWYFNEFEFLNNLKMPEQGKNVILGSDDESVTIRTSKRIRKRKRSQNFDTNEQLLKATMHMETFSPKKERDELDLYEDNCEKIKLPIPNNENWLNFIKKYRNLRELWDINSEKHNNKHLREKAYEKLLHEYKNIDENATMEIVKKKIRNMRIAYKRELKKKIAGGKSGAYEPTLWYFNEFEFLENSKMPKQGINSISSSDDESVTIRPMKSGKKRTTSQNFDINELPRKATMHMEDFSQKKERDEADIYAEAWACSYRKLSAEQKLYAKKACEEIFVLGQLERLTLNSVQADTPRNSFTYSSKPFVNRSLPRITSESDVSVC